MCEPIIVAAPATAAEAASVGACAELGHLQDQLDDCYARLGACTDQAQLEALRPQLQAEADALRRTAANLKSAHARADSMADELSARLSDVHKQLDRRWWRLNPPSNTTVDLREEGSFARGLNGYKLALVVIIGSFAGVVIELLWCLITNGYLESRAGLVWGPFNLLYGVGAAALTLCLYRYRNRGQWLSFLGGMIVGTVVEYGCSWLQETLLGSVSWDYSHLPFHINGRVCLLYSFFWGILGVLWIKDIYPRMAKALLRLPARPGKILTWALAIFLAVDAVVSGLAVARWSERREAVPPANAIERVLDAHFPDERLEKIYANMVFE